MEPRSRVSSSRFDIRVAWLLAAACAACGNAPEPGGAKAPAAESVGAVSASLSPGIHWPADQLLPSFPAPAATVDLIQLHGAQLLYQAEGATTRHDTGRLETDGWLCQTGIDAANQYMVYSPSENGAASGSNTAQFSVKTDNNTADNAPVIRLEVYDETATQVIASQVVTRMMFPVASTYTTLSLPFTFAGGGHALDLRVFWYGSAYTKVDWLAFARSQANDELPLFASLKGIVNAKQPRIFSYEGDAYAEGPTAWLQSLGMQWNEVSDNWSLIAKYQSEVSGIVVYDDAQPDTINLATTLASSKKALVVAPSLVDKLTQAPYGFPIALDLRGQFSDKLSVYQSLYDNTWPSLDHRLVIGLDPGNLAAVREYATALGVAAVWLDPQSTTEGPLLDKFLSTMSPGGRWMGWWPSEGPGVTEASKYGVATNASDFSTNLTVHGGTSRTIHVKPIPPKPVLANKLYVAFILSDGDNLQYIEHLLRKLWNDPGRGTVPMGWTLSPAMVDAMPGALDYLWTSSTEDDCLLSGPSGYGYTYPNTWPDPTQLDSFLTKTEEYDERAGFRIITVWNTITGGIDPNVGAAYAKDATSLLGLTAQNTGGGLTIYGNSLPGMALTCNYCTGEQAMKDFIATGAQGWDGQEPRFLIIQAQPWQNVTPTSYANVAATLGTDYVVVRPDHIFELIREANGLPINPVHQYAITASTDGNGDIAPSGTVTLNQNEDQTFTFTAHAGYSVASVTVDGVAAPVASPYAFVNVTADHSIAVAFSNGAPKQPDGGVVDGGGRDAGPDGAPDAGGVDGGDDSGTGTNGDTSGSQAGNGAGCACRTTRSAPSSAATWGPLALVGLAAGRRRRRPVHKPAQSAAFS
jgi:MYXO-CTERM domain-containing protein